jgi:hypothetical protein
MTRKEFLIAWLLLGALAAGVCSLLWPSAHLGEEFLPVGIDSFYHARRILDTAADPAAFYEFDKNIHAPEGSLLAWPWGYDYALGRLVRLAGQMGIPGPPIAFLIWVPVAAVFLSIGLIMLIARRLSLSTWSTVLAGLCVALSPLTQLLHGTGMIDHHFAEYIFVLAMLASGLKWFFDPEDARAAAAVAVVLGIAPAVHNGLFVLQVPILVTLGAFWLQDLRLPRRSTITFCLTLLAATVAVLIPSLPFRLGHFEFYTLSWFHLYIAASTAIVAFLFAYLPRNWRSVSVLVLVAAVLLVPLGRQIVLAQSFLAGTVTRLDAISEVRSLRQFGSSLDGLRFLATVYSALVFLAPLSAIYCLYRSWTERSSPRLLFWVCSVLGLCMLAAQFRLHYFGSFALYLPWLVLAERVATKRPQWRRKLMLAISLALLLMYALPLRYQLVGSGSDPAGDMSFRGLRPILETLRQACAEEPGIVLADNDAGHYIRYYTNCPVIANNFLLTRQHEQKIEEIDRLTSLSAAALPAAAPHVRYLLLRPVSVARTAANDFTYVSFSPKRAPLIEELLLRPSPQGPSPYVLLAQANMRDAVSGTSIPFIRLYKVKPAELKPDPSSPIEVEK